MLRRVLAVLLVAAGLSIGAFTTPAWACEDPIYLDGEIVGCADEHQEEEEEAGPHHPSTGGVGCPSAPGGDCIGPDGGVWYASHNCYAQPVKPPPAIEDPIWGGHTPDQGSIWGCTQGMGPFGPQIEQWFVPGGGGPIPNPEDIAKSALGRMKLATAQPHMAPAAPLKTYVGLETWLWTPESQWRDLTLTVRAGATTVTVTAKPVAQSWDMGDGGAGASCGDAGRVWIRGMGDNEQTSCSYTYSKVSDFAPNREFPISAWLSYQVDWTCTGQCSTTSGTLGQVDAPAASTSIRVTERQTVVIQGSGN